MYILIKRHICIKIKYGDWGLGIYFKHFINFLKIIKSYIIIIWGLGIGDWGLGPIPNPQSPIPNPQSPIPILYILDLNIK